MISATSDSVPTAGRFRWSSPVPRDRWIVLCWAAWASLGGWWATWLPLALPLALSVALFTTAKNRTWALGSTLVLVAVAAGFWGVAPLALFAGFGFAKALERTWWQAINGALASFTLATLGWWLAPMLGEAVAAGLVGASVAASMWVARIDWVGSARIPSPTRIRATLPASLTPPCLKAHQLDRALAKAAPESSTRDGLGEVAAWVYRLSLGLKHIDGEMEQLSEMDLLRRIASITEEAEACGDAFLRDRKLATAGHLGQLLQHRRTLQAERDRTESLVQYALAFLEEARAGLALSRLHPDAAAPDALPDVLHRLRDHARDSQVLRRTQQELAVA